MHSSLVRLLTVVHHLHLFIASCKVISLLLRTAKENMSTSSSISFNQEDADGSTSPQQSRPSSPVAKTLDEEQLQEQPQSSSLLEAEAKPSSNKKSSIIPNLLSSGKFPPPPHSPTNHHHNRLDSMSPPNIIPSPTYNSNVSSPSLPPVPPTTPQLSINFADGAASAMRRSDGQSSNNIPALHPPLPVPAVSSLSSASPTSYTLNNRSVSPPLVMPSNSSSNKQAGSPSAMQKQPPNIPPSSPGGGGLLPPQLNPSDAAHYNKLLNQELTKASQYEKNRISNLTKHEETNYTTIDEYKHALSRERRHSTSLSLKLTQYKFLTRYTSCNIHNQDEIEEEARINTLIKNIDKMKNNMNEEKVRVVMELEREEERIINNLMGRLEEVKKEKADLEFQISNAKSGNGNIGGTKVGGASNRTHHDGGDTFVDEEMLIQRYERMNVDQHHRRLHGAVVDGNTNRQEDTVAEDQQQEEEPPTEIENETNEIEEGSEEEEKDNEDILGDVAHDPEMEEELANLLKMKMKESK